MTLWIVLTLLCLAALGFVIWPLYRSSGRLTPLLAAVIVLTVGLSAGLYQVIGNPNAPSGAGAAPDTDDMVVSLRKRLEENPHDIDGWLMLGRSYQSMQRYDEAVAAFEKAIELEQGENAESIVGLGIALLEREGGEVSDRASSLFEHALTLDPANPNALFYGGGAAARRGDEALAADRWEALIGLDAPPEILELLQRKVNEWRGLPAPVPGVPQDQPGALISINLSVAEAAIASLPADATVFVIARDPAAPSPPIAVSPLRLSELPAIVELGDSDSMVAARPLSGFSELEIVARVSVSGQPMAQTGDWSGSVLINANNRAKVDLVIDQPVP